MSTIDTVSERVSACGVDLEDSRAIAYYIADRCAGLSIASAHSSSHSSLHHDPYLVQQLGLEPRQISAWLALIRGTRSVARNGRTSGGSPGMVETLVSGRMRSADQQRLNRLAFIAATGHVPRP
jgi:hypothetical protein